MRLSGSKQRVFVALWCVIALVSIVSLGLSIYALNRWDRLPAADLARYYPEMTPADVQSHADWQGLVLDSGLSLPGYAWIFTVARLVGGLALLLLSVALMRRYGSHLMGALMAMLLPVLAAAGIWTNPLFGWGVGVAPWMRYPAQVLGWLTWCGAIILYAFPDGRFTPRWTVLLAVLLLPLTFIRAFGFDVFLNPENWPGLFYLTLDVLVIGGILVAILYRWAHAMQPQQRRALGWYVAGWSVLVVLYFANLLLNDVYSYFAGHEAFEGAAALRYVLVSEPLWFAGETILAIALAISLFRERLLEMPALEGSAVD
jgi:hypothetical protein